MKLIRIYDEAYELIAKNVRYPESIADALNRLLGITEKKTSNESKETSKKK